MSTIFFLLSFFKFNLIGVLSRLKNILKIGGDVLMKDVQEIATVVEPKRCQEKTQCVEKDETGEFMCFIYKKSYQLPL